MFYKKTRDNQYLADLKSFLQNTYGFAVKEIAEAKRGFYGETWKVVSESGNSFVKIVYYASHMEKYTGSFAIMDYMVHHGIGFIGSIIRTKQDDLYCLFNGGVLGAFTFVEGEHTEAYDLSRLISHMAVIYNLQIGDLAIQSETFDISCVDRFYQLLTDVKGMSDDSAEKLVDILQDHCEVLHHHALQLPGVADRCGQNSNDFHITSGDVGGNVILEGDRFTIIDWDDIVLAPIERDLWFYMKDDLQLSLIHETLAAHGVTYRLQKDRLVFYCIRGLFHYLCEYLCCFRECEDGEMRKDIAESVKEFLETGCWMDANLAKADGWIRQGFAGMGDPAFAADSGRMVIHDAGFS